MKRTIPIILNVILTLLFMSELRATELDSCSDILGDEVECFTLCNQSGAIAEVAVYIETAYSAPTYKTTYETDGWQTLRSNNCIELPTRVEYEDFRAVTDRKQYEAKYHYHIRSKYRIWGAAHKPYGCVKEPDDFYFDDLDPEWRFEVRSCPSGGIPSGSFSPTNRQTIVLDQSWGISREGQGTKGSELPIPSDDHHDDGTTPSQPPRETGCINVCEKNKQISKLREKIALVKEDMEDCDARLSELAAKSITEINPNDLGDIESCESNLVPLKKAVEQTKEDFDEHIARVKNAIKELIEGDEQEFPGLSTYLADIEIPAPYDEQYFRLSLDHMVYPSTKNLSFFAEDDFYTELARIYVEDYIETFLMHKTREDFLVTSMGWASSMRHHGDESEFDQHTDDKRLDYIKAVYNTFDVISGAELIDVSSDGWPIESTVPEDIRKTIDDDIVPKSPTLGLKLKEDLKTWETQLTPQQKLMLDTIRALGQLFAETASDAMEELRRLNNVLTGTIEVIREGVTCIAKSTVAGSYYDFQEMVTGVDRCSGEEIGMPSRIISGMLTVGEYVPYWGRLATAVKVSLKVRRVFKTGHRMISILNKIKVGSAKRILELSKKFKFTEESLDLFVDIYQKAPHAKIEIDEIAEGIAQGLRGRVAKSDIKSMERSMEKIAKDYSGDPRKIKDLARNTIIVDKDNLNLAQEAMRAKGAGVVVHTAQDNPLGYSGINTTIKTNAGITAEIQINTPAMIYAKEPESVAKTMLGEDLYKSMAEMIGLEGGLGHKYYEQWRALSISAAEKGAVEAKSRAYYDAIRKAAYGD